MCSLHTAQCTQKAVPNRIEILFDCFILGYLLFSVRFRHRNCKFGGAEQSTKSCTQTADIQLIAHIALFAQAHFSMVPSVFTISFSNLNCMQHWESLSISSTRNKSFTLLLLLLGGEARARE